MLTDECEAAAGHRRPIPLESEKSWPFDVREAAVVKRVKRFILCCCSPKSESTDRMAEEISWL